MSNNEDIKVGSVVMLKSGSPQMVVIELLSKPGKQARCQYWDVAAHASLSQQVPVSAIETIEQRIDRETRLQELIARNPSIELPEGVSQDLVLVMSFESIEHKEQFIKDSFGGVSTPTLLN